jgi:hypothetical protein
LVKVATPPTAETVVVPVTPEAVEVIVTEAVEVADQVAVGVLNLDHCTPKAVPAAVPLEGGSVVKAN